MPPIKEQVEQADGLELTLICYKCMVSLLQRAKVQADANDWDAQAQSLYQTREFLAVLMDSLDLSYELSGQLLCLYLYANKLLTQALSTRENRYICEACDMLGSLLDGWRMIEPMLS